MINDSEREDFILSIEDESKAISIHDAIEFIYREIDVFIAAFEMHCDYMYRVDHPMRYFNIFHELCYRIRVLLNRIDLIKEKNKSSNE